MSPLRPLVLGLLLLSACATRAGSDAAAGDDVLGAERTPEALRGALVRANERFVSHPANDVGHERAELAQHQAPPVAVLACADSRVAPEWVFGQRPGRLFVVREAGNVPDENGIASLEYAVDHLDTRLVVVLGHERCGAVGAAVKGGDPGTPALRALVAAITPAVDACRGQAQGDDLVHAAIEENARRSAEILRTRSALLRRAIDEGKLRVVAAVQDLDTGRVRFLE